MRYAVLLVAVLVGCAKKNDGDISSDSPIASPPTKRSPDRPIPTVDTPKGDPVADRKPADDLAKKTEPRPAKPDFATVYVTVQNDYHKNEFEADQKYLNKWGHVTVKEVVDVGRTEDGVPFLATRAFGHQPPANGFFWMAAGQEAELAKVKKGFHDVVIEGRCRGKRRDGIDRGLRGYDFVIGFADCRIVSIGK